jgi:hypothetical protein
MIGLLDCSIAIYRRKPHGGISGRIPGSIFNGRKFYRERLLRNWKPVGRPLGRGKGSSAPGEVEVRGYPPPFFSSDVRGLDYLAHRA